MDRVTDRTGACLLLQPHDNAADELARLGEKTNSMLPSTSSPKRAT